MPKMQKFAMGTSDVPDLSGLDAGIADMGGGNDIYPNQSWSGALSGAGDALGGGGKKKPKAPDAPEIQYGKPSMGYAISGYSAGKARVPGRGTGDTVPALLTPGEAVLTRQAAERLGRDRIDQLNKRMPIRGAMG
jgi:hypothetical protein